MKSRAESFKLEEESEKKDDEIQAGHEFEVLSLDSMINVIRVTGFDDA